MNKENIKKNAAIIALVAMLLVGGASIAVEESIDHTHEYCPFNYILGINHQVNVINNNTKYADYKAENLHNYDVTTTTNPIVKSDTKGVVTYTAPVGYSLVPVSNDSAEYNYIATKRIHYVDCIRVTNTKTKDYNIITK